MTAPPSKPANRGNSARSEALSCLAIELLNQTERQIGLERIARGSQHGESIEVFGDAPQEAGLADPCLSLDGHQPRVAVTYFLNAFGDPRNLLDPAHETAVR
jgi:hypothetical protein